MSKFYLINTVQVGTQKFFAGQLIDDTSMVTAPITAAGGLLWPDDSGDAAIVSGAGAKALQRRLQGANEIELESIMQTAVQSVQKSEDATQDTQGPVAYGARIRTVVLAITQAQIAAKGAVTSATFDAASAFPAGARLLGVEANVTTKVQNVGDTDVTTYAVGTDGAGKSAIAVAAATDAKTAGISGGDIGLGRAVGAEKLRLTLSSDVNLSTLTAGAFTVTATYVVPASS